ncbi:MAG: TonB-dependent receptor, partial [Deinococcales bacterium]|nr:TonB-dependent receptor [Chitinophagaceae bacterium]
MQRLFYVFLLVMSITNVFAQQKIRGIVRDNETNQPIPLATVLYNNQRIICNKNGGFEITIASSFKLEVASNGYLTKEVLLTGKNDVVLVFLEPSNILMNEVQVTGLSTQRKSLNTPGTIGTITNKDFDRNNGVFLQNTLNLVSGVRMEMRTVAGGTRIVMRGYGNQTNTNNGIGYKAYLNDIPLTDADGSTTLDDVDFDNLGRVEVFKGPSSSIYGTGIGGVITMYNQKAPEGSTVLQSYLSGSDGLIRTNTTLGVGTDKTNLFVNYGHQEINGFRQHHTSRKDFLNINADIYNDEKRSFFVYASYTKTHDLLAGQLDSLNFLNHPDSADVDYIKNDAFSDIESARVGLTQEYKFSDNFSNKTT